VIERWKGALFGNSRFSLQSLAGHSDCPAQVLHLKGSLTLIMSKSSSCQEFIMSARNGDKSRFNRERKQKIALRRRTHELLKRAAARRKGMDPSARANPQSVLA